MHMIFGYNTDVKTETNVYHVQTEDRGKKHPVIDSVIYCKGRILDRRSTSYVPDQVTPEQLKEMVTNQHRELVDAIRTGAFVPGAPEPPTVELLNPDALFENGRLLFHLRVPAGTRVEAFLEVDGKEAEEAVTESDQSGEVQVAFSMPQGPSAAVLFRAVADGGVQTLKFVVRQQ